MKTLSCLAGALMLSSAAHAATVWNMSAEQPDANYLTQNARQFAEEVKAATKGELDIRVQSNSVLLKRPEVKRGVQQGVVPIGEMLVPALGNEDPIFEVDSVPLLASSFDASLKLWQVTRPMLAERLDKQGLILLYGSPWPPQGIYTKNPLQTLADLKGVRFRAYSASTSRLASLMGAIPTTVNTPEVPQAFSTGVIDAMVTSPATGVDTQAWDYTKYYYDAQVFIPQQFVIANKRAVGRLSDDQRKALYAAAERAEARGWELGRQHTQALTDTLAKNGMTVGPLPDAIVADLRKIGDAMLKEWLDKAGKDGAALIDAYRK